MHSFCVLAEIKITPYKTWKSAVANVQAIPNWQNFIGT